MKKRYYLLFLLSFFAFMPLTQAASAPAVDNVPAFNVEADAEMTRAEKRALRKELRQAMRESRDDDDVLIIVLAILIPPLGIYLYQDEITIDFWVSLILAVLGVTYLFAAIFALLVVLGKFSLAD